MTEGSITRGLVEYLTNKLRPSVVFKHSDKFTSGMPDTSVTAAGHTTWMEMKFHSLEKFETHLDFRKILERTNKNWRLQLMTMVNLAAAGRAKYIIWVREYRQDAIRFTIVVDPRTLASWVELGELRNMHPTVAQFDDCITAINTKPVKHYEVFKGKAFEEIKEMLNE